MALVTVSAGAAISGAAGPTAPTGLAVWDAVLRAVFAVSVTLGAARCRRWALLILTGAVAATAPVAGTLAVAVSAWAALGLAFLGAVGSVRRPWLGALVGALAATAALRSGAVGSQGLTALVVVGSSLPVVVSAYRRQPHRPRRLIDGLVLGLVAAGLVSTVGLVAAVVRGAGDVERAVVAGRAGIEAVRTGDQSGADARLTTARAAFADAEAGFGAWYSRPGRLVPFLGRQIRALETMAATGADLMATARQVASEADYRSISMGDGRVDTEQIARLDEPLRQVQEALGRADSRSAHLADEWLLPPIDRRYRDLVDDIRRATAETGTARAAVQVLPDMLGRSGPRRYFLAFVTPAESRAAGGFLGNWAEVVADDGKLTLTRSGRSDDLIRRRGDAERRLEAPADYVDRYAFTQPEDDLRDVPVSPDFPTVGAVFASSYAQAVKSPPVDGVVAIDPRALAAMLKLTGPLRLEGLDEPLTADNAVDLLLRRQYTEFEDRGDRADFLARAGDRTFEALLRLERLQPSQLSSFGPVIERRHLMAYSPRPAEQDLYRRLGIDGAFPNRPGADRFAVVTQNAGNNKIDVFLQRSVRYVVELDPSTATLRASATIRLRNDAPSAGLPPVVIASRPELRVPPGSNPVWFTFYSPHQLRSATIDGRPLTVVSQHELGLSAVDARFSVPPGQEVTVELRFDGVLEDPNGYRLDWYQQPTVNPDDVEVRVVAPPGWPVEAGPDVGLAGGVASVRDPQARVDGSIDLMWR